MMPLHVTCPRCRFPYVLGDQLAGQTFTCTACGSEFPLPAAAAVSTQSVRLPPAEVAPQYQHVVGNRHAVALDVLGIHTVGMRGTELGALQSCWSFRHVFLLVGILAATLFCISSPEMAMHTAPAFFGAAILCMALGYCIAIHKAMLIELKCSRPRLSKLDKYLINPIVLLIGDPAEAAGALRVMFLAFCLLSSAVVAGLRAGSLRYVLPTIPQRIREASAASPPHAGAPLKTVTLFPDADHSTVGETASTLTDAFAGSSSKAQPSAQAGAAATSRPSTPPPPPDE